MMILKERLLLDVVCLNFIGHIDEPYGLLI